jgi:hypothetical protein
MCRYAWNRYKPHFACFSCRKGFKRRRREDVDPQGIARPACCPQCSKPMSDMGLDFRPPKRTDVQGWTAAEQLFAVGVTFRNCGCGAGWRPVKAKELEVFLIEQRARVVDDVARQRRVAVSV